jgi:hypothetical protein
LFCCAIGGYFIVIGNFIIIVIIIDISIDIIVDLMSEILMIRIDILRKFILCLVVLEKKKHLFGGGE